MVHHPVIACRLFGVKLWPEFIRTNCKLDPKEQTSVKNMLRMYLQSSAMLGKPVFVLYRLQCHEDSQIPLSL